MKNWEALKALQDGWSVCHGDEDIDIVLHPSSLSHAQIIEYKDGWSVYENPGRDWAWACKQLVEGKAVRRKCWNEDQVIHRSGHTYEHPIVWMRTPSMGPQLFALSPKQMQATDWVLAEEQR